MANINLTQVFGQHSGSDIFKNAHRIALQAIEANPLKNSDGSVARNDEGGKLDDFDAARNTISDHQAGLQDRILRNMGNNMTDSSIQDTQGVIDNLRKLEVASAIIDVYARDAAGNSTTAFEQQRLGRAMAGLNPADENQRAFSSARQADLDAIKGTEGNSIPGARVTASFSPP